MNARPVLDDQFEPFDDVPVYPSKKSGQTTFLLCLFLGSLGIHRFYTGNVGTGILMLLTCGGFGVWTLIDLLNISQNKFTDGKDKTVQFHDQHGRFPMPSIIASVIVGLAAGIALLVTGIGVVAAGTLIFGNLFQLAIGGMYVALGLYAAKKGYEQYQNDHNPNAAEPQAPRENANAAGVNNVAGINQQLAANPAPRRNNDPAPVVNGVVAMEEGQARNPNRQFAPNAGNARPQEEVRRPLRRASH